MFLTGTVIGVEPFLVPSQPATAMEKRPAVPPATTTWISSTEGNLGMSSSNPEHARTLGDDQHGVGVEGEVLDVPQPAHGPAEGAGEAPGRAARVVPDAVRRLAGEHGPRALLRPESPLDVVRRAGG